jgi:hypothetical protein
MTKVRLLMVERRAVRISLWVSTAGEFAPTLDVIRLDGRVSGWGKIRTIAFLHQVYGMVVVQKRYFTLYPFCIVGG